MCCSTVCVIVLILADRETERKFGNMNNGKCEIRRYVGFIFRKTKLGERFVKVLGAWLS